MWTISQDYAQLWAISHSYAIVLLIPYYSNSHYWYSFIQCLYIYIHIYFNKPCPVLTSIVDYYPTIDTISNIMITIPIIEKMQYNPIHRDYSSWFFPLFDIVLTINHIQHPLRWGSWPKRSWPFWPRRPALRGHFLRRREFPPRRNKGGRWCWKWLIKGLSTTKNVDLTMKNPSKTAELAIYEFEIIIKRVGFNR